MDFPRVKESLPAPRGLCAQMCVVLFVQKFGFLQKTAVNSGREMETETERDTERQRQRRRETETEGGRETERDRDTRVQVRFCRGSHVRSPDTVDTDPNPVSAFSSQLSHLYALARRYLIFPRPMTNSNGSARIRLLRTLPRVLCLL